MNLGQFFENLQDVYADILHRQGYTLTARALRSIAGKASEQVAQLELRAQDAEKELRESRETVANMRDKIARLKRQLDYWRQRASFGKQPHDNRRVEILQKRCDELVRTADSLSDRLEVARAEKIKLARKCDHHGNTIEIQRQELVSRKKTLEERRQRNAELKQQLKESRLETARLSAKHQAMRGRCNVLCETLDRLAKQYRA